MKRHSLHPLRSLLPLAVVAACSSSPGPATPHPGATLSLPGWGAFEAETNLATDAGSRLIAAWMALSSSCFPSVGYAFSQDGGASWSQPTRIDAPDGRRSEDPSVAVDSQGMFYLAWLGTQGGADYHVYLARSAGGPGALGAPVDLSGGTSAAKVDFPRIAVGAGDDILVTWLDRASDMLAFARSTDHGATFLKSAILSSPGLGETAGLVQPCLDRSAAGTTIYATYLQWNAATSQASILLSRTADGGQTWTSPGAAVATDALRQPPTCAVRGDQVWVSYARGTDSGSVLSPASSLWVRHSADGGATYDADVRVSGASDDQYLLPKLALAGDGTLVVASYQGKPTSAASLTRSQSRDGGATWSQQTWTSAGAFAAVLNPCATPIDTAWFGDSIGLVARGAAIDATFADNTTGASHIRFASQPIP